MARSPRGWHPEDIKAAVRKTGVTLTSLSLANGMSESACRCALGRPLHRAEKLIAATIGVPAKDLWPDRYDAAGNPLPPRLIRKTSSRFPARHGEKRAAA